MKSDNWADLKTRLDTMKEMIDPRYLVESLGIKVLRETPKELRGPCIIHGGDNPTAFRFNKERNSWVCFTKHCHEPYGGDVIGLIRSVMKTDFMGAVDYLAKLVGQVDSQSFLEYKRRKDKEMFIRSVKRANQSVCEYVSEEHLAAHMQLRTAYFLKQGFSRQTLSAFEIAGGYKDSYGYEREIIPIRDEDGRLVAYSLRDINKNESDFKYILTPGFDKDKVLYNLNNVKKITDNKPLIVVEGFKSVWRLHQYGIKKVVASIGSKITTGQKALLYKYALNGIVVMFDNDEAGIAGALQAYEELKNKMEIYPVFITETDKDGKGLDPSDLDEATIRKYLNSYL
jgi:DNA primase